MRIYTVLGALLAGGLMATSALAQTAPKIQVGVLQCKVAPAVSFIIGSVRDMSCQLLTGTPSAPVVRASYKGTVSRFGIDIGVNNAGTLSWAVFAPHTSPAASDLAGKYVGVSADAAWGLGGGANVLLGGSKSTIALQPLSLQGTTGVSIAAGVSDLTLTPAK
ncbi:DUF992 domain-containing protein [Roseixanthobacter pseudopolyaromaticivorans]|uniref:DUF992 domain-containing protein n=1 Tax=Xanthobacteraceae TaxID=335928 RepID=UPI00372AF872